MEKPEECIKCSFSGVGDFGNDSILFPDDCPEYQIEILKKEIHRLNKIIRSLKDKKTKSIKVLVQKEIASDIIDYLNEKTGNKFSKKATGNHAGILLRLKEGYTEHDCKIVIDKKVSQWKGTDYEMHLNPKTLFSSKNFDVYLNQIDKKNGISKNKSAGSFG